MSKRPPQNHKVDLVLLSIEMTQQAYHVKRCWHIIKQLQQARIDYPEEINTSLGFYRTIFDSLVTSVFIGLGKLYDQDVDTYSLYELQRIIGRSFGENQPPVACKVLSQKLRMLSSKAYSLKQWRNKQYAHNAQEYDWDWKQLDFQHPLYDEDIESLIDFACEYVNFFSTFFLDEPIPDRFPDCCDLENTLEKLHSYTTQEVNQHKS